MAAPLRFSYTDIVNLVLDARYAIEFLRPGRSPGGRTPRRRNPQRWRGEDLDRRRTSTMDSVLPCCSIPEGYPTGWGDGIRAHGAQSRAARPQSAGAGEHGASMARGAASEQKGLAQFSPVCQSFLVLCALCFVLFFLPHW